MIRSEVSDVLQLIAELYSKQTKTQSYEDVCKRNKESLMEHEDEYFEALRPYFLSDVKASIRTYFRYKDDKVRPRISQIIAMFDESKVERDEGVIDKPIEIKRDVVRDLHRRYVGTIIDGWVCLKSDVDNALDRIFNQIIIDCPAEQRDYSNLLQVSEKNGYLHRFMDFLKPVLLKKGEKNKVENVMKKYGWGSKKVEILLNQSVQLMYVKEKQHVNY